MDPDVVCLNHPDEPAVNRCTTCHKPLCRECVQTHGGSVFCSEKCAQGHFSSQSVINQQQATARKKKIKRLIRNVVILIVVAGIAGGAYVFFKDNPEKLSELKDKAAATAEKAAEKGGELAGQAADKAGEVGSSLDPVTKKTLSDKVHFFARRVNEREFDEAVQENFSPKCVYFPPDASASVSAGEFISLIKKNVSDEFKLDDQGSWKYNEKTGTWSHDYDMFFKSKSSGGMSNKIMPISIAFAEIEGEWRIVAVKARGPLETRRAN